MLGTSCSKSPTFQLRQRRLFFSSALAPSKRDPAAPICTFQCPELFLPCSFSCKAGWMFSFSLLLLIEISQSKLWLTLCTQTWAQLRAQISSAGFSLSLPCFAVLPTGVTHKVCLSEKLPGSAALTFHWNAGSKALPSCGCCLVSCLFLSFSPLCRSCTQHVFSSPHQTWTYSWLHSQHCSALSLMHAQVTLTRASRFKTPLNSCITHRKAFG